MLMRRDSSCQTVKGDGRVKASPAKSVDKTAYLAAPPQAVWREGANADGILKVSFLKSHPKDEGKMFGIAAKQRRKHRQQTVIGLLDSHSADPKQVS